MAKINEQKIILAAKKIDDLIDFKKLVKGIGGNVAEAIDGLVFRYGLLALNNVFSDKISKEHADAFEVFLDAFNSGDWSYVDDFIIQYIDELIDIPYLDESAESQLISGLVSTFVDVATTIANKN